MELNISAVQAAPSSLAVASPARQTQAAIARLDPTPNANPPPAEQAPARGQNQAAQPTSTTKPQQAAQNAGIQFEYKDGHRVMKVNDSRGVLIYQVPPKGELQLILEQENKTKQFQGTA